ncbi:MAG: ORF6N domain-containing protein [Dysgonamonadaceae bacterium]|jgi:hypothetical protein|nr:ORF6N domain-containing protein [Dysgonamonadaceae bacterium]
MELQIIQNKIRSIRQQKVLLDRDLAEMYGVETKVLNQAVKRNIERFRGDDFMFQLTKEEYDDVLRSQIVTLNDGSNLRSQFATSKNGRGQHRKYVPYAFTQLGVAMLSSVLNSETAIEANRNIMRAFVMLQQLAANYTELNHKLDDFMTATNMKFSDVYQVLTILIEQKKIEEKPRRKVGYIQHDNDK